MEKTHWKKVFNSDYLGSCDLEDGKDLKVIIKSVSVQEVKGTDGTKKSCNVAVFTDAKVKPMILNVTNCKVIKKFAKSSYINEWNNIPVQIFIKDDIKAFGDITEGLRIRDTQPSFAKPKLTPGSQAWPNAVKFLSGDGTMEQIKAKYDITSADEETLKQAVIA